MMRKMPDQTARGLRRFPVSRPHCLGLAVVLDGGFDRILRIRLSLARVVLPVKPRIPVDGVRRAALVRLLLIPEELFPWVFPFWRGIRIIRLLSDDNGQKTHRNADKSQHGKPCGQMGF